ncbi:N-6 DNA methylase [Micromonospora sp. SL4-19]|uniref:N-6 DNA methylase n=1 Tax=Micromonospora sp. SL4-19 TaxID=3399129 RepID=UPI003A4E04D0
MDSRPGFLTRSEIAQLAGVERPAVTNWQRRYEDFPQPVTTPDGEHFRSDEVIAWLSPRRIPAKVLRPDEAPGTTYGDRLAAGGPGSGQRRSVPSGSRSPNLSHGLTSFLTDLPRMAVRDSGYWHVLLALAFVRRFRPVAWQHLALRPEPSEVRHVLSRAFAAAELPEASRTAERLVAVTPVLGHSLTRIIGLLGDIPVPSVGGPGATGEDELTELFDYAFDRLADEVRYAFVTPRSITRLAAKLLGPITGGERCFDPFCRSGELLVELLRHAVDLSPKPLRIDGSHPSSIMVELAQMNVAMHSSGEFSVGAIRQTSELSADGLADVVVTNPPFGLLARDEAEAERFGPSRRREMIVLQSAVASLGSNGRGAVVMPNVAAFSRASADRAVRQALIDAGAVTAVVALPSSLFAETNIGVTLWLVRRPTGQPSDVLFIDARAGGAMASRNRRELRPDDIEKVVHEYRRWQAADRDRNQFDHLLGFSMAVAPEIIAAHDYSLLPSVYVGAEPAGACTARPGELGSLYRELARLTELAKGVDARVQELFDRLGGE